MIIESVVLHHIRMPLRSTFETSSSRNDDRDCILTEITADGVVGYGECVADRDPGYSSETVGTSWYILKEFLIPEILGKDIHEPGDLQANVSFIKGHLMCKAAVEMALWDIKGKQEGKSLRSLLGGIRPKVEVGVSVGIQDSPETLIKVVEDYIHQGYGRIKLKIKPNRDITETRAVRNAFPTMRLQVDANSAYTLDSANLLKPLDELDLLLIEQPLNEDDIIDHAQLQPQFRTPICLDESILCVRHARQALDLGACRIINIKPGRVGGMSQAVVIHDLCQKRNIPVWCGGMLETGVGRAANLAVASLPGFILPGDISATERYYFEDITRQWFTLNGDSTITVPDAPGLGVEIDPKNLEKYTLTKLTLP
jgi:O-succinylbenzoate synthase